MKPLLAILLAFSMSACVIEAGGDDPDWVEEEEESTTTTSYSNRIKLECNGSVLVDRTFTARAQCVEFRDSNTFYCSGIMMPISC